MCIVKCGIFVPLKEQQKRPTEKSQGKAEIKIPLGAWNYSTLWVTG